MKVTPEFVWSFETKINGLISTNWDRVLSRLIWDRFMKVRPASSGRELLVWLLETAQLYPEGMGGNTRFDDMVAANTLIENEYVGAGLRLTRGEIEDNQMRNDPSIGAFDYAAKWAKDIGAAAAYYPQKKLFELIQAGTSATGYDGVPFFYGAHPNNPNGGGGTYSNLITGVNINVASVPGSVSEQDALIQSQAAMGRAMAAVAGQRFINGVPRMFTAVTALVPTAMGFRARQLAGAQTLVATDNKPLQGALNVIVSPELDSEPTVFYLGVEDTLSDDLGAFVLSNREEFALRGYSAFDEVTLSRFDQMEWHMKGRKAAAYGHPFLFYRVTT